MVAHHQQTLARAVTFSGIGLHSGEKIRATLKPGPIDGGIKFEIRERQKRIAQIPASIQCIGSLAYNTSLKADGKEVQTVEHLLSALHGFNIDNAVIELDKEEVPIMDGSAAPFIYLLSEAGIASQDAPRQTITISTPVRVEHEHSWIEAVPSERNLLEIDYCIDFPHPAIGRMSYKFADNPPNYAQEIAPARTFGFLKEVEHLRKRGLIRGATMQNAVVLDDQRVISGELRFQNEFVRHKVLDFWGDILLMGRPLAAKIKAYRAGHALHAKFVECLVNTPDLLQPAAQPIHQPARKWLPELAYDNPTA